ncbi:MAG: gas vesicle protein [Anaerolineae bacterium]
MTSRAIETHDITLLELLDRILDKGVVIAGDLVISVADVDLIYLGLKVILTSVETLEKHKTGGRVESPEPVKAATAGLQADVRQVA